MIWCSINIFQTRKIAELPSALPSHSLVDSINLPVHSHILVVIYLIRDIQGHLSIVLPARIALNFWVGKSEARAATMVDQSSTFSHPTSMGRL